ncbi:beta-Ig-H3/fasciclin [Streptomyces sp. NPDC006923]|uniref:beta-Ig-H3/fasciclin n=1 Tax=Streptomyces sp. NPDC006923 TaxID=3155355 RepID=UPI0033C8E63F
MRLTSRFTRGIIVLAALGGSLALTPTAVHAAPAPATTAPSCVSRSVYTTPGGFDVYLKNNCAGTMSVQVDVSSGGDSPCYVLSAGADETFEYRGVFGNYFKTILC